MNNDDKLVLGTLAGVDLVLSPEHYEEYKGTLNKQLEEKDKEITRLNNILDELEKWLEEETRLSDEIPDTLEHSDYTDVLDKLKKLKENNK